METFTTVCPTCGQQISFEKPFVALDANVLVYRGKYVRLSTPQVAEILHAVINAFPNTAWKSELYQALWGAAFDQHETREKHLQVLVCRLRKDIKNVNLGLRTISGKGYKLLFSE